MPSLRHAFPRSGPTRDDILLNQRDVLEMIGENASGEQARHAGACNDRMPKSQSRLASPQAVVEQFYRGATRAETSAAHC